MFKIKIDKKAKKFKNSLDFKLKNKIDDVVDILKLNPYHFPYKKLRDYKDTYRIRVGNIRLSFKVFKDESIIKIIKIGFRENFYK